MLEFKVVMTSSTILCLGPMNAKMLSNIFPSISTGFVCTRPALFPLDKNSYQNISPSLGTHEAK